MSIKHIFSQYLVDFKGHISKEGSKHFSGEFEQEYNRKSRRREKDDRSVEIDWNREAIKKTNIKHFVNVSVTVLNKHNQINRVTS